MTSTLINTHSQQPSTVPFPTSARDAKVLLVEPGFLAASLADFEFLRPIGQGSFAQVWLARLKRAPQNELAVKVIRKGARKEVGRIVNNELASLRRLDPALPFVCHLRADFSTAVFTFLVLDYAPGGDLFTHLQAVGPLSERHAKGYVAELGLVLDEFRRAGIVFRDLKTENILIGHDGHLKLTDFGLSKIISGPQRDRTRTICGTPHVLAPEMLRKDAYDYKADWYALGTCMHEMLTGYPPFYRSLPRDPRDDQTIAFFQSVLYKAVANPKHLSRACQEVLQSLLEKDPDERCACLEGLLGLEWFDGLTVEDIKTKRVRPAFVPAVTIEQGSCGLGDLGFP